MLVDYAYTVASVPQICNQNLTQLFPLLASSSPHLRTQVPDPTPFWASSFLGGSFVKVVE